MSVGFWEQVQEAAGNADLIEKEQRVRGVVFASICKAGKRLPQDLNWSIVL